MSRSWFHGQRCACAPQRGPTEQPRAGGCGRTGRTRGRTRSGARPVAGGPAERVRGDQPDACGDQYSKQYDSFIIRFISIHLLNNFHELTPDIQSPILTPLHLLVPFAITFFFHGNLLLDSQSFLQFHDRATLVLEGILLFEGS